MTEQSHDRNQRVSVMLTASVTEPDGASSQHRVINISDTGLCIGQASMLRPAMAVLVTVGEVDHTAADVVWARAGAAGLRFRSPIDVDAARQRRSTTTNAPSSGWLVDRNDAYRRG